MSVILKPAENYREAFSFRNSEAAIARFPFPFPEDAYMYSVNIEPATSRNPGSVFEHWFDIDEHYRSEVAERAIVLQSGRESGTTFTVSFPVGAQPAELADVAGAVT